MLEQLNTENLIDKGKLLLRGFVQPWIIHYQEGQLVFVWDGHRICDKCAGLQTLYIEFYEHCVLADRNALENYWKACQSVFAHEYNAIEAGKSSRGKNEREVILRSFTPDLCQFFKINATIGGKNSHKPVILI
jgi:hypothetical protein